MTDIAPLKDLDVFKALTDKELQTVADPMKEQTFEKDDVIFEEDQHGDSLYIIVSGEVEVSRRITADVQKMLLSIGPGNVFGEMALVDPGRRSATAKAKTECRLLVLSRHDFFKSALDDNVLGIKVFLNLAVLLTDRVRQANDNHRVAMQWGLRVSGATHLNFDHLLGESARLDVDLLTGRNVQGTILKVEQTRSGHELTILDDEHVIYILPYHAIASIRVAANGRNEP